MNTIIVFTKSFKERTIKQLAEDILYMGAQGADMAIREGYPVEPENIEKKLPEAVRVFKDAGISIPMVTSPGGMTDPSNGNTEKFVETLSACGIKLLKIGYWTVEEGEYRRTLKKARQALEKWSVISEKYGVKILLHTHSGPYIGSNAASMTDMLEGFSPKHIGAYPDTAHLSFSGEPLFMVFEILQDYLSAIGIKDFCKELKDVEGKKTWQRKIVPVGEGFSEWNALGQLIKKHRFDGPFSFHSEYSGLDIKGYIEQTKRDIEYFKTHVLINA